MSLSIVFICLTICAFSATVVVKENLDDLVAIVQVFRHGQRSPIFSYKNDPYKDLSLYELGKGQLTKVGKQQHYELGLFTRRRYGSFLPTFYYPDWFRAQTTDVDRTHMSCQSNLAAIFKPTANETWNSDLPWQPIPVHPASESVISDSPDCAIFTAELANVVLKDSLFATINKDFAELYTYLSNHTGNTVTTVVDVFTIYDSLNIQDELGFVLPSWTESVYPEPMLTLSGYGFLSYSYTTEMKRLTAGVWLKTAIYDNFVNIFKDPSSYQKYQMWSAHDSNIGTILNTLGGFEPHYPAFASTIYFELRNISGTPVVNVYHKDDELDIFEPITIEGCQFDCLLSDFPTVLSPYLLDVDTWKAECAATSTPFTELDSSDEEVAQALERINGIFKHNKPK